MADGRYFKFGSAAIIRLLMHILAQHFTWKLKLTSCNVVEIAQPQISLFLSKSKMAAAAILTFALTATCESLLDLDNFLTCGLKMTFRIRFYGTFSFCQNPNCRWPPCWKLVYWGSHASWKVLDFSSWKFQDLESPGKSLGSWKVLEVKA